MNMLHVSQVIVPVPNTSPVKYMLSKGKRYTSEVRQRIKRVKREQHLSRRQWRRLVCRSYQLKREYDI